MSNWLNFSFPKKNRSLSMPTLRRTHLCTLISEEINGRISLKVVKKGVEHATHKNSLHSGTGQQW
jgi:hypothetical protein